jgi:hypothetical protein
VIGEVRRSIDVIARSVATKQSIAPHTLKHGLLRFARNDDRVVVNA